MIRAWKVFKVGSEALYAAVVDYRFDGPVNRTVRPVSVDAWHEVYEDPVGAMYRHGEAWVRDNCRCIRKPACVVGYNYIPSTAIPAYGFFAFRCVTDAADYAREHNRVFHRLGSRCAYAEVDLFGRVVEHERGYRAEAFRFAKIHLPDEALAASRTMLENRYQCDVEELWTSEKKSGSTTSRSTTCPNMVTRMRLRLASWISPT